MLFLDEREQFVPCDFSGIMRLVYFVWRLLLKNTALRNCNTDTSFKYWQYSMCFSPCVHLWLAYSKLYYDSQTFLYIFTLHTKRNSEMCPVKICKFSTQ